MSLEHVLQLILPHISKTKSNFHTLRAVSKSIQSRLSYNFIADLMVTYRKRIKTHPFLIPRNLPLMIDPKYKDYLLLCLQRNDALYIKKNQSLNQNDLILMLSWCNRHNLNKMVSLLHQKLDYPNESSDSIFVSKDFDQLHPFINVDKSLLNDYQSFVDILMLNADDSSTIDVYQLHQMNDLLCHLIGKSERFESIFVHHWKKLNDDQIHTFVKRFINLRSFYLTASLAQHLPHNESFLPDLWIRFIEHSIDQNDFHVFLMLLNQFIIKRKRMQQPYKINYSSIESLLSTLVQPKNESFIYEFFCQFTDSNLVELSKSSFASSVECAFWSAIGNTWQDGDGFIRFLACLPGFRVCLTNESFRIGKNIIYEYVGENFFKDLNQSDSECESESDPIDDHCMQYTAYDFLDALLPY